ncbi:unnamed protein product [Adineta steineri]|uniref:Uncharacterized protein n=1 Tax=Adineta steineri TaxID=433720 RepID=A0A815Y8K0_9BILA|nr:unnamed protein product [Adineta steineri]CAF1567701.1 unnamed protein product [Adineta steineri]
MIARMFTVLASVDTCTMISSKQTYRVFSQPALAIKCSIAVIFCCPLIAIHIFIMNTTVDGQYTMAYVILPPLAMIIFSCLAYFNMKKLGTQHNYILNRRKRQQHSQLVRMITTQIIVHIISTEFNPMSTLYKQLTANLLNYLL